MYILEMSIDACCRAIRIADPSDASLSESASDLQSLLESRIKCFNNLAATQLKVMLASWINYV